MLNATFQYAIAVEWDHQIRGMEKEEWVCGGGEMWDQKLSLCLGDPWMQSGSRLHLKVDQTFLTASRMSV